jgi:hypothetical protein
MTSLSKSRTQEIVKLHEGIASSMRRSVQDAIRIGELLAEAKEEAGHGQFLAWIEGTLPFDGRTAERYMRLSNYSNKIDSVSNLQDAYKRVEQLEDEARQKERARKDRLIAEKQATGKKPAGWDRSIDYEEKRREDDTEYEERKRKAIEEKQSEQKKPQEKSRLDEIIDAVLSEPAKHEDLELADMRANAKQGKIFIVLKEYIESFDGVSRQLEATYNLMRYLKRIAIDLQPKTQGE